MVGSEKRDAVEFLTGQQEEIRRRFGVGLISSLAEADRARHLLREAQR